MLGRALLWAAEKKRIERFVTEGKLSRNVVDRFVAGEKLEDAVTVIRRLNARGIGGILNMLGEGVTDPAGAQAAADAYLTSIKRVEETGIDTTVSVKPTQLGLPFDKGVAIDHLRRLAAEAEAAGTAIEIDMEQSEYVFDTIDLYRSLHPDFPGLRLAIQAYLRRTPVDLETMAALKPKVRLVKGAYAEPVEVAFQSRAEVTAQYRFLIDWLFERGTDPGIATHDERLLDHARDIADQKGNGKDTFEIQMLYGVHRELQDQLANKGYRVRTYVPFGSAWYPYLMRRLAERPANIRFFMRALVRG